VTGSLTTFQSDLGRALRGEDACPIDSRSVGFRFTMQVRHSWRKGRAMLAARTILSALGECTMAKPSTRKKATKKGTKIDPRVLSHPGTHAMIARVAGCNKPPILWRKQGDGSWLECFLNPDCTYGNCRAVDENEVPAEVRNGG
jgi:hypothetical protein